jgi:protein-disulfide isomerase
VITVSTPLRNKWIVFGAVGAAAVAVAVALIVFSAVGSSDSAAPATETITSTPAATVERTPEPLPARLQGAAETTALFKGIPQQLNVLGRPSAPVTMIEFADLQCPFCRDYAVNALPALVDQYVRTGQAKLVFSGMHFLGPDSEKALRAVSAAGLQGRLWQFLDLLYKSQGPENAGWVTDALLRSVGASIPGFDTEKMLADMNSAAITNALALADRQAEKAGVNSTPTFFAGRTGATLEHLDVSALTADAFRPTLDALVG